MNVELGKTTVEIYLKHRNVQCRFLSRYNSTRIALTIKKEVLSEEAETEKRKNCAVQREEESTTLAADAGERAKVTFQIMKNLEKKVRLALSSTNNIRNTKEQVLTHSSALRKKLVKERKSGIAWWHLKSKPRVRLVVLISLGRRCHCFVIHCLRESVGCVSMI